VSRSGVLPGALALAERDLILIRRNISDVLLRSLVQPLLFVFVFTYVYPKIGSSLISPHTRLTVATLILPGLVGFSAMFCGIFAVGLPFAMDLGLTREIDDRAMAPINTWLIPIVRLALGAVQATAVALIVPLMIKGIALQPPDTAGLDLAVFIPVLLLCGVCTSAMGLFIAGLVNVERLPAVLTVVPIPLIFLSSGYYPWASLGSLPALKAVILLNPLTYVAEALRASATPHVAHMSLAISLPATSAWTLVMATVGVRAITRQIVNSEARA
jgi:ABC-2 type transport system permease protein